MIIRLPEIILLIKLHTLSFYIRLINFQKFILYKGAKRNILDIDDAIKNLLNYIELKNTKNDVKSIELSILYPISNFKTFEKILNKKHHFKIKKIDKKNWFL